ncbi:MAG: o-succinylbenzoate synthase [Flavobacteriaceae bacterium]|nr:o-succinylbenzoate synthase [Flavobacteriaceae bacterium]
MKATYKKYILHFKIPGGTSRGILNTKETYFLKIQQENLIGVGECALFKGLSIDDRDDYEDKLIWLCKNINLDKDYLLTELKEFPSIQFGLEQALLSFKSSDIFNLFPSDFTDGLDKIAINGLIWMGDKSFMQKQIKEKLKKGFTTIKLKIGAIDFKTELDLLKSIRSEFTAKEIELRVDANGAFHPQDALEKLKKLSTFDLHSIEQPIAVKQWETMAFLCEKTPLPIALDEELIGVFDRAKKENMMQIINPQFIILKPSLIGGIQGTDEWIEISTRQGSGWWITSALESNIGLNAIAQYTYTLQTNMPQGLGTGGLFTNNIPSPLLVDCGKLFYKVSAKNNWDFTFLNRNK